MQKQIQTQFSYLEPQEQNELDRFLLAFRLKLSPLVNVIVKFIFLIRRLSFVIIAYSLNSNIMENTHFINILSAKRLQTLETVTQAKKGLQCRTIILMF
jgi:hypothetical protein